MYGVSLTATYQEKRFLKLIRKDANYEQIKCQYICEIKKKTAAPNRALLNLFEPNRILFWLAEIKAL